MAYTTINDPSAYFQTALYTGNGGTQSITNDGNSNLRPDWIWGTLRDEDGGARFMFDSVRGATKRVKTNANTEEQVRDGVSSFNADGFTLGSHTDSNSNNETAVAWQWAAGGATPTQTYKVVVVSDSGNKYRFRNSADNATYAASAVTLDLQEGGTYTFDVSDSSVSSHPFVIGTSANSNEYSTGVTYKLDGVTKTYSQYTSGFSAATTRQLIITVAASAPTLYYWCSVHSGMGGQINTNSEFGSTNFDGSILSKASVNTTAGFSIATWTGNGTGGATIGHGLGAVPHLMIVKKRSGADDFAVYHQDMASDPQTDYINLNGDGAKTDSVDRWNDTSPTSTVATLGDAGAVNGNSATYVGYFFNSIKGYSKFGSYNGNNNVNGTFVYTGFKPAFIILKNTERTQDWRLYDARRPGFNVNTMSLKINETTVESSGNQLDILSNGFKFRTNDGDANGYDENHIYWAFAKRPIVASNNIVGLAG